MYQGKNENDHYTKVLKRNSFFCHLHQNMKIVDTRFFIVMAELEC